MDVTVMTNGTPETQAAALPVPEFLTGRHTKLRPVLEADLPTLAPLMAESPGGFGWELDVWTLPALRKKFNDEKEPGFWSRNKRFLAITDLEGALCGLLVEDLQRLGNVTMEFHIANSRADRDVLGPDALAVYLEYKRGWQNCPRVQTMLLETETAKREWLLGRGFEIEISCKEAWLYQGEPVAIDVYGWVADWVLANRAPDGVGE